MPLFPCVCVCVRGTLYASVSVALSSSLSTPSLFSLSSLFILRSVALCGSYPLTFSLCDVTFSLFLSLPLSPSLSLSHTHFLLCSLCPVLLLMYVCVLICL